MSYNIEDMGPWVLLRRRKGLDYEVSVKWKKKAILRFLFTHDLVNAPVAIGAFFI